MNRQISTTQWTALYTRLSRDDEFVGDSGSIVNQKAMLEKYAEQNGFSGVVHFCDDGYSGKDFDRPDWKRMIAEVEAGKIGTVICKDMSRIGRDYLQTGYYTEIYFHEKGVRFIAVSNSIDSEHSESAEFAPFLNIVNEWYLRDTSRKIKAAKKTTGMSGARLTNHPIYGYVYEENNKEKWVIDPEAAEVVRRIYALAIEGKGVMQVTKMLQAEKVERPSYYQYTRGIVNWAKHDHSQPYMWSESVVADILHKPEYMGHTVNFRTGKDSYKDKTQKRRPKEDWVIFENTHPAIVDKETWETAQNRLKTIRRTDHGAANPLSGLIFCADCGAKMYNHRNPTPKSYVSKKTGELHPRSPLDAYKCSTYSLSWKHGDRQCTQHFIRTQVIEELALAAIKSVSNYAKTNKAEFVKRAREESLLQHEQAAKSHTKRITKAQKRVDELNTLIKRIYEDFVAGRLNEKRFETMLAEYEQEQTAIEPTIAQLQAELDDFTADSARVDQFMALAKRYTDFTELTPMMIGEFIEKIIVHEADKSSGEREQEVEIYLNFIGKFDVPMPEPTPEDMKAAEEARLRREKRRAAQQRYVERQEQKRLLEAVAEKKPA